MTDRPTTAAPHKVLAEAMERERPGWTMPITEHDWEMWGSRVEMTLQAFGFTVAARQPDSEALRQDQLIADLTWALSRHENALLFGTLESPHEIAETLVADIVKARAALPPSAPPALDATTMKRAIINVICGWQDEDHCGRDADSIAAEYARLSRATCAEHLEHGDDKATEPLTAAAFGLDVERLAAAIYNCDLVEPVTFHVQTVDHEAARIATEYARLATSPEDRP